MIKKLFLLIFISISLVSCSDISGRYSQINIGYLGIDNSISSYEFGMFGSVKYSLSTSGSRSSNSYKSHNGKFKADGDRLILNFGGSDRILSVSDNKFTLTDQLGNVYKKQ